MFPSTMQTLPLKGHNVAYQCKGLDQSNIVCEYEVNMSTNEKVITEKQKFNTNFLKNIVEYQGHLKVTMLRVGKVNPLTNDNVIRGK